MAYLRERGLYNSLYDHFDRIGCWWCPKQPLKSLRALWRYSPEKWAELRTLERIAGHPFKHGYPASELDERFKAEFQKELAARENARAA